MIDIDYIRVSDVEIEFEDGSMRKVDGFQISRNYVTIGMFTSFCESTRYITETERLSKARLFAENELVESVPLQARKDEPAFCLTWNDARNFTEWAGVRLPSEEEWLAAAVVDTNIYDRQSDHPFCNSSGRLDVSRFGDCLQLDGFQEWTGTQCGPEHVVWRSGPQYFRYDNWKETSPVRRGIARRDQYDLMRTFRVCTE